MRHKVANALLWTGFFLLLLPLVFSLYDGMQKKKLVQTYEMQEAFTRADEANLTEAEAFNARFYLQGIWDEEAYACVLDEEKTGMMGTLTIPKISVYLPIYHGTEEEVLQEGVGHVAYTSLPVGGENTHSVLSGHRGLPHAKLFTRLDELTEGDVFVICVCGRKLAYEIFDVQTMSPPDAASFVTQIVPGEDLVSLVTCTPYGINTMRLVLTARRTTYDAEAVEQIKAQLPSWRERGILGFTALLAALCFLRLVKSVVHLHKGGTSGNQKET